MSEQLLREKLGSFAQPALASGFASKDDDGLVCIECEPTSLFDIGSIAKTFTGLMLARLVERGVVREETRASELIDVPLPEHVTLRALATHTSGLPRIPVDLLEGHDPQNPYAHYGLERLVEGLRSLPEIRNDGVIEYSNYGFMVLGHLLSVAARVSFAELLSELICEPLGLEDTTTVPGAQKMQGHNDGSPCSDWDDPTPGAGGIWSSARDMLRYLRAQMEPESTTLASAIHWTHKVRERNERYGQGIAWFVRDTGLTWHSGGTGGFGAFLGFDSQRGVGVFGLRNGQPIQVFDSECVGVIRALVDPPA